MAETEAELRKRLEEAENKIKQLQQRGARGISFRVSQKGGVSVYGLGRFPVTLYKEQWLRLLEMADDLRQFIDDQGDNLKSKSGS